MTDEDLAEKCLREFDPIPADGGILSQMGRRQLGASIFSDEGMKSAATRFAAEIEKHQTSAEKGEQYYDAQETFSREFERVMGVSIRGFFAGVMLADKNYGDYEQDRKPRYSGPILVVAHFNSEFPLPGYEWAAYVGDADKGEEWVRSNGDKLPEPAARYFFPLLQGTYRR